MSDVPMLLGFTSADSFPSTNQVISLHRPSAWTSNSNELLDWPVQAVLGHGNPTRGWTCLSKQMKPPGDCSDKSIWHLLGQPCLRTVQTGWSQDSSDLLVQADNWCSGAIMWKQRKGKGVWSDHELRDTVLNHLAAVPGQRCGTLKCWKLKKYFFYSFFSFLFLFFSLFSYNRSQITQSDSRNGFYGSN